MTEPRIPSLGEKIKGILLRPELVQVLGVIDPASAGYAVAIRLMPAPGDEKEPAVIMVPLENVPALMRLIQDASDELHAGMTQARI